MNGNLQTNISDPSHDKSPSDRIACKMVSNAPQLPEASQKQECEDGEATRARILDASATENMARQCPSLYDALPFLPSLDLCV
ncbi:hypothetical protein HYQ46_013316 [Verticillium longisporum]|nr:hypothetical protein HYQ46_013316 [Verticillium longisporum]